MVKLLLKFNGALMKELAVEKEEISIGRKPENDLVIDNPSVSGRHCRVVADGAEYFVEDLNSTNGTFLRDQKIARAALRHGDVLAIAKHTVEFVNEAEALAALPAKEPVSSDATVIMTAPPPAVRAGPERIGHLRVLMGDSARPHALTQLTTYIGKSDQAQIKLKGLFAPDMAACIAKKQDGYYITALKSDAVKWNGQPLMDQAQVPLKEGDLVDVAHLKFMFFLQESGGA
jgi:pSer/pThr/pTyr-binding forkhead associated (FHA) protein